MFHDLWKRDTALALAGTNLNNLRQHQPADLQGPKRKGGYGVVYLHKSFDKFNWSDALQYKKRGKCNSWDFHTQFSATTKLITQGKNNFLEERPKRNKYEIEQSCE